jgi:serine/threonine protein kinase
MSGLSTDSGLSAILRELQLTVQQVMERNENFLLLKCAAPRNKVVVLKYSHSPESRQGRARISNEAALVKNLKPEKPLRFLKYYADGQNFLVTEFEEGELLLPNSNYDDALRRSVADALIKFQLLNIVPAAIGVTQQTGLRMFYIKGLLKHLLHLWPIEVSLLDSFRCLWIVISSLPLLEKPRVICHGDLLPTNLLFKAAEKEIVFTDLESFLSENHPLYDVLSFCTIDDGSVWEWNWQKRFIEYYLERTREVLRLDSHGDDFLKILRALLVFLLLYRLNESRANLAGSAYFDGLSKWRYTLRKVGRLLAGAGGGAGAGGPHVKLKNRKANLQTVISKELFARHVSWLLNLPGAHNQESA